LAGRDLEPNMGRGGAFLNCQYFSFELIARADFHGDASIMRAARQRRASWVRIL
jgi:hypothetical protein